MKVVFRDNHKENNTKLRRCSVANRLYGFVPLLGMEQVQMPFPQFIPIEEIRVDDIFEVEISGMDVYMRHLVVTPKRRVSRAVETQPTSI
jgi:hypothetical protein